jgi:hypothetical protein
MANLRFSPGLLSSIRDFGSSLTEAPASRANTLTGAGVQPASLGGMLARNVGGLMGRDMRTSGERLAQAMADVPEGEDRLEKQLMLQLQEALRVNDRVTAAKLANTLENLKTRKADAIKRATPKVASSQTQYFKDSQGNRYAQLLKSDESGQATFELQPLGNAPEKPVGRLERTEDGRTAEEDIELAFDEKLAEGRAERFSELESEILSAGRNAITQLSQLNPIIEIVDSPDFKSGGFQKILSTAKQFLGMESAEVGQFNKATSDIILEGLQKFTGAISEGERKYLIDNLAGLEQSPEINRALLKDARDIFEKARLRSKHYRTELAKGNAWTEVSWSDYLDSEYEETNGEYISKYQTLKNLNPTDFTGEDASINQTVSGSEALGAGG